MTLPDPCASFLAYLEGRLQREPHNAEMLRRLAGSVRKVATLA